MMRLAFGLVFTLACGGNPAAPLPLPIGQPFDLRVGRTAVVEGDVLVSFTDVFEDSRCPVDVVCVTAGEATVRVVVFNRAASVPPFVSLSARIVINGQPQLGCISTPGGTDCVLRTSSGKGVARTAEYTVTLIQLAPSPTSTAPVPPADYVGTFIVTPN
jgi:hypothetical protein